ncbi:MAG: HNH/ENDO VII family nuclease, partial [Cyclobacteriaceae bacterium]
AGEAAVTNTVEAVEDTAHWVAENPRSIGTTVGEFIPDAAAAYFTGGTSLAASGARVAGREIVEEVVEETVERAVREGLEEAGEEAAERAVRETGEEVAEQAVKDTADELPEVVVREGDEVADDLVDEIPPEKTKGRRPSEPEYPVRNADGTLSEYGKWYYERPSGYRSGVRDDVWEAAEDTNGDVFDPLTDRKIDPDDPWDMGHQPGYEFRKHQQSAADRQISREQFLDEHNNPDHYRPELPSSNRSHADEMLDDTYFGD